MTAQPDPDKAFLRFLKRTLVLTCIGYMFLWWAILSKCEPGDQAEILKVYRAHQHEAAPFPSTGEVVSK